MRRWAEALTEFWQRQEQLWERYDQRHELSGREALALVAAQPVVPVPLHWDGTRLRGAVLPDGDGSGWSPIPDR